MEGRRYWLKALSELAINLSGGWFLLAILGAVFFMLNVKCEKLLNESIDDK